FPEAQTRFRQILHRIVPSGRLQSEEDQAQDWREWEDAFRDGDGKDNDRMQRSFAHSHIRSTVLSSLGPLAPSKDE
ncbi:MAG: hypothetical protein SGCHY_005099, partial [Lobulomycetales sp.]